MRKINKRVVSLGILAALVLSMTACSSGTTTSSTADAGDDTASTAGDTSTAEGGETSGTSNVGGEIEWLHIWPEYDEIWTEAVADFEAETGAKINVIAISWDKLSNSLQTYFAAGDAPDVMATFGTGTYKAMGAIENLTPYLTANDNEWLNQFSPSAIGVGKVGENYYGIPLRSTATLLMYNKTIMDENGWTEPANQAEFEELMGKIKEAGYTPLICPGNPEGYQIAAVGNNLAEHELYKSGKLETPEYLTGHVSDLSAEFTTAAAKLREWFNNGYIDAAAPGMTREEAQQSFLTQKGVFFFANNNEYSDYVSGAEEAGFELGFMAMPAPDGVPTIVNNLGSDTWMLNASSENKDTAIAWLKYLSSDEFMQKFADETGSVVGNKNVTYSNPDVQQFADIFSSVNSYKVNTDYVSNACNVDINMEFVNFLLDPSYTPEAFGEYAANAWAQNIAENAN